MYVCARVCVRACARPSKKPLAVNVRKVIHHISVQCFSTTTSIYTFDCLSRTNTILEMNAYKHTHARLNIATKFTERKKKSPIRNRIVFSPCNSYYLTLDEKIERFFFTLCSLLVLLKCILTMSMRNSFSG